MLTRLKEEKLLVNNIAKKREVLAAKSELIMLKKQKIHQCKKFSDNGSFRAGKIEMRKKLNNECKN